MPPKNKDKPQLYILRPDGTKVMLGEIWDSEIICEHDNDIHDEHWITQPMQEYEFTARWNPTTKILYFVICDNCGHAIAVKRGVKDDN